MVTSAGDMPPAVNVAVRAPMSIGVRPPSSAAEAPAAVPLAASVNVFRIVRYVFTCFAIPS